MDGIKVTRGGNRKRTRLKPCPFVAENSGIFQCSWMAEILKPANDGANLGFFLIALHAVKPGSRIQEKWKKK